MSNATDELLAVLLIRLQAYAVLPKSAVWAEIVGIGLGYWVYVCEPEPTVGQFQNFITCAIAVATQPVGSPLGQSALKFPLGADWFHTIVPKSQKLLLGKLLAVFLSAASFLSDNWLNSFHLSRVLSEPELYLILLL